MPVQHHHAVFDALDFDPGRFFSSSEWPCRWVFDQAVRSVSALPHACLSIALAVWLDKR